MFIVYKMRERMYGTARCAVEARSKAAAVEAARRTLGSGTWDAYRDPDVEVIEKHTTTPAFVVLVADDTEASFWTLRGFKTQRLVS